MIDSLIFAVWIIIAFVVGFRVIPFIIDLFITLWVIDPLIVVAILLILSFILLR